MQLVQNKADLLSREMTSIEEKLKDIVSDSDIFIRDKLADLFYSGKRLRPKLVILSGLCFSPINDKMIYSAVASELIHTASLVHDDIIDRSDYRRNRPTINYVSGNHIAVLAGDFLFAKAFEIMSKNNLMRSMEYLVIAIQDMCTGEILQAHDLFNIKITEESYFEKTRRKTASLISASCMAGAQSGGANGLSVERFGLFGRFLGFAFQIADDILDFTGNKKDMGKPVAHDLEEGNITLPIIYLLQDPKYKEKYEGIINNKTAIHNIKSEIINDLKTSGALAKAHKKAEEFAFQAKDVLKPLPDSGYKNVLIALCEKVVNRIY